MTHTLVGHFFDLSAGTLCAIYAFVLDRRLAEFSATLAADYGFGVHSALETDGCYPTEISRWIGRTYFGLLRRFIVVWD